MLMLLAAAGISAADISLVDPPSAIRLRPGTSAQLTYAITDSPSSHTTTFTGVPVGITCTATPGAHGGQILIAAATTASAVTATITTTVKSGTTSIGSMLLPPITIDPPPRLKSTAPILVIEDDVPYIFNVEVLDNAITTAFTIVATSNLQASIASTDGKICSMSVAPLPDAYGPAQVTLRVTDDLGPTDIAVPFSITNTNDPPLPVLAPLPDMPVIDPQRGDVTALVGALGITPGVDPDVTWRAGDSRLSWEASIDGVDGVDLLFLVGGTVDGVTYTVGESGITSGGKTRATWSRPDGDSRRIRIASATDGSQVHLERIACQLRYTCIQGAPTDAIRTLRLHVHEPVGTNIFATSPAAIATCQVLAQNLPPVAASVPMHVLPEDGAPVQANIVDSDPPEQITVRVAAPLPRAGRVEPPTCTAAQLAAGGMRYLHTDTEESDDLITLEIIDPRNPPVVVRVPVTIRIPVDRMAVISDPCLSVTRDLTTTWPLRFSCAPSLTQVAAIGGGLDLPLPAGISCDATTLRFDWSIIPQHTLWLPLRVVAETSQGDIDPLRRRAEQRMMIRVRSAASAARTETP